MSHVEECFREAVRNLREAGRLDEAKARRKAEELGIDPAVVEVSG